MFKLGEVFRKMGLARPSNADGVRPDWPLWFDDFSFDARCYSTLRCSVIFARTEHSVYVDGPSRRQPHSPDWKDKWEGGFGTGGDFKRHGFPGPIEIRWTALDGIDRLVALDLDRVFPERLILHNVPQEDVREGWASSSSLRRVEILLEVNDRTLNVYMRAWVLAGRPQERAIPGITSHRDLMLAWTRTYTEGAHVG